MNHELIHLFLFAIAVYLPVMGIAWAIAWKLNFFSLVDAVWAIGIGLGGAAVQALSQEWTLRSVMAATLALIWGLRLGGYLAVRLKKHFPIEDTRYQKLRQQWSGQLKKKTFLFFMFQGFTQCNFVIPYLLISQNNSPVLQANEILGLTIFLVGILGESHSDRQLSRFKADINNKGKVCNVGLWKYSRHPNYFFEWIVWCGIAVFSLSAPSGVIGLSAPILMLYFLIYVTGVRPSEEQALLSRGELYRQYQRTTSPFVPWIPKKE